MTARRLLRRAAACAVATAALSFLVGAKKPKKTFAPDAVPAMRILPRAVTLGGTAALEVQVELPAPAGKPTLSSMAGGTLTDPVLEDGVWIARYKPPASQTSPGYDVVMATTRSGAVGAAPVQWIARAKLPVSVTVPDAAYTVTVGGRDYGPVKATGKNRTVTIEVEIPPGAREVSVTATVPGKAPLHTSEALAVPPLQRILVNAPAETPHLGKPFALTLVVLDAAGKLSRAVPQVSAGANGRVASVTETGPGVWHAEAIAENGPLSLVLRGEGAHTRVTVKAPVAAKPTPKPLPVEAMPSFHAIPVSPTCDTLAATPGEITTAAQLRARITDASAIPDLVERRDALVALGCRFPDEHAIQLQLAATDLLVGDLEGTIAVVSPLLADESEIHEEHLALGYSYRAAAELRLGKLDAAANDARAAEAQMPGLYSATYTLGEAEFLRKNFEEATAALLSAYRTAPQFASGIDHEMLAQLLERRGDKAEAVEHLIAAARLDANNPDGWRNAARGAEDAKRWARAQEAWLMLASQTVPGLAANREARAGAARASSAATNDLEVTFIDTANDSLAAKNPTRAAFLLQKVLAANPKNLVARYELARALYESGSLNRAVLEASTVLNDAPHWAPALILAGDVERVRGDKARAESMYREALAIQPATPLSSMARWRLAELDAHGH